MDWETKFRIEAIEDAEPEVPGWVAYDLTLRPMDRRGRVNGRTRHLATLKVGGPPESIDMTGLRVGIKATFRYSAGPTPTTRATLRPETVQ